MYFWNYNKNTSFVASFYVVPFGTEKKRWTPQLGVRYSGLHTSGMRYICFLQHIISRNIVLDPLNSSISRYDHPSSVDLQVYYIVNTENLDLLQHSTEIMPQPLACVACDINVSLHGNNCFTVENITI